MKSIVQYLPFQLTIALILGVIIGNYVDLNPLWIIFSIIIMGIVSFVLTKFRRKKFKVLFQLLVYIIFILIGSLRINSQKPPFQPNHYQNLSKDLSITQIQITEELKDSKLYYKYIGKVMAVDFYKSKGKILLSFKKDSLQKVPKLGDVVYTNSELQKIPHPLNPYEFDYAFYMQHKGVFYQMHLSKNTYKILSVKNTNLLISIGKIKEKTEQNLSQYHFGKEELGIINALLLGDKKLITRDLQGNYAAAGVVHILAVSGLHVGIFYWILTLLFKPFERFKNGKLIIGFLIVLLLWGYAMITGLSGSVVRAVTMFSFMAIGMLWTGDKRAVEEAVFASLFILVLIQPLYLFDVGFQLSYVAVLGIVYFQPVLQNLIPEISHKIPLYFWQITTVSIAATLVTTPLTLYYFHQFPGLFLLSNLVIIPFVKLILILGILTLILASLHILPDFLVTIYNQILRWMNQFVIWVGEKDQFLIQNISFSLIDVLVTFIVLFFLYQWIKEPQKFKKIRLILGSIILFQMVFLLEKFELKQQEQLWVFHQYKQSLFVHKFQNKLSIFNSHPTKTNYSKGLLKNYTTTKQIDTVEIQKINFDYFTYKENSILIIDSIGVYNLFIKPKVIILTQSPKINLERLIDALHPQKIIADGTNYPYLIKYWEYTCKQKIIEFHYTGADGAYKFP